MSDLVSAITAQFDHPNRKYRRSREEAAAMVAAAINAPYSPETLRKTPTPYANIFGRVRYADEDLLVLAESILSGAQKCGPGRIPGVTRRMLSEELLSEAGPREAV
jgi:hypothetical protein